MTLIDNAIYVGGERVATPSTKVAADGVVIACPAVNDSAVAGAFSATTR